MKKPMFNLKPGRLLAAALLAAIALPGFSEATGTLSLEGTVPGVLEITVSPQADASALNLSKNETDLLVALITETSKRKAGYTVTMASRNAGAGSEFFFKSVDPANTDTLKYTLTYNEAPVVLTGGSALITNAVAKNSGTGPAKEIRISYNGMDAFLNEDAYGDLLTFTIAAK